MADLRVAAATTPNELSVSTRLADRREVSAGRRAYSIGFEDGRFYANGWHITGEMGGVLTPPMKLADGVWFGLVGQWVGPATTFTSGWGYSHYSLPDNAGLKVSRTDFVPDGVRGALFGLTITNPGAARTTTLSVDAHSELMGQYPWGFKGVTPNASDNLPDTGADLGRGSLTVVSQVPAGQPSACASHIRLGDGFADVSATHSGSTYTTMLAVHRSVGASKVWIGHTLPRDATVSRVVLDGRTLSDWTERTTNRGLEVTVPTKARSHTLVVTAG